MDELTWSDWIDHDDSGVPPEVEPNEIVQARMENGDVLAPMESSEIDWCFPGDAVVKYRRRIRPEVVKSEDIENRRQMELA